MRQLTGVYVQFADRLDETANARIHGLCDRLLIHTLDGVTDVYPGYINLYVEFDAAQVERSQVIAWIRRHLKDLTPKPPGREVVIPVRYDGEDLTWIAERTGLSVSDVIERHSSRTYRVYAVGFVPGQPMMGSLDQALYLPRRATPRARMSPHTLAMAVSQTTVYTLPTPGGWHVLGTALEAVYDPHRERPFLLDAGDTVRFKPAQGETPPDPVPLELLPLEPNDPVLRVEKPGVLDVIVDAGRFGMSRYGMARSGPMDERSARVANALVGNPTGPGVLEMTLKGPTLIAVRDVVVGVAGYGMQPQINRQPAPMGQGLMLRAGDVLSFQPASSGVRAYLAVAGGFQVQAFMGSVSTDLKGCIGRPLRAGDVLGVMGQRVPRAGFALRQPELPEVMRVRLLPGPQATPEALEALTSGEFTVSSPDRMGVRFEGPKVPGGELISEATPMGAVQITIQGDPILLLNDRGRIGGYAKPAVIDPRDLPWVAQLRPGQRLRFVMPRDTGGAHWVVRV